MTSAALVVGPAALTASWLSQTLGVEVAHVAVSPVGTGQTGSSYRLEVSYAAATELPVTFVVKLPAEDPAVRERVAFGYRAEVAFYAEVAGTVRVPLPTCYASAISDDAANFVLLLADLAPAVQGDQLSGCTPAQAVSAAVALAGLHGPRWCDPTWSEFTATVMPRPDADLAAGLGELVRTATDMFLDRLGPRLRPEDRATLDACPSAVAPWLLLNPDRFALLHGDFRLDNLMFAPDASVTVVDWQTVSVGLPARDLAYFVATGLEPDARTVQERHLVEVYFDALVGWGVSGYDLHTCWNDYRLGMLQTPLIATLGAAFSTTTGRGDEMTLVMLSRACAAIRELGTLELIEAGQLSGWQA